MELVFLIAVLVVCGVVLVLAPTSRSLGDAQERAMRSEWGGADVERQFKAPRDRGGGLL